MKNKIDKADLVKGINVVAGVGAITVLSVASFKLGYKLSTYHGGKGLELCFQADPTLKEHLVKVMTEVAGKKLMEN